MSMRFIRSIDSRYLSCGRNILVLAQVFCTIMLEDRSPSTWNNSSWIFKIVCFWNIRYLCSLKFGFFCIIVIFLSLKLKNFSIFIREKYTIYMLHNILSFNIKSVSFIYHGWIFKFVGMTKHWQYSEKNGKNVFRI